MPLRTEKAASTKLLMHLRYLPTNARPAWILKSQGNYLSNEITHVALHLLGERHIEPKPLI